MKNLKQDLVQRLFKVVEKIDLELLKARLESELEKLDKSQKALKILNQNL